MDPVTHIELRISNLFTMMQKPHASLQSRCDLEAQINALNLEARLLAGAQREADAA